MLNFRAKMKSIERFLDMGEYTIVAKECVGLTEQALQQVFSLHSEHIDERVRHKVQESVQKRDKRGEGISGLTMGQLVHVLRESKFLNAWAQSSGKDLSGLQVIDLDKLTQLRNKLIHKGREATRAEAEFLFNCLRVILETFGIVSLKDSFISGIEPKDGVPQELGKRHKLSDENHTTIKNTVSKKFFISYAHSEPDEEKLARFLESQLLQSGHKAFIDLRIKAGMNWVQEIHNRIDWCDYFVVLLSETSMESEMVQEEIRMAHRQQRETGSPKIIPVRLGYFGPLDYELEICLGHLQFIKWESAQDSAQVLEDIFRGLDVKTSPDRKRRTTDWIREAQSTKPVTDNLRPQSAIDPRAAYIPGGTLRHDDPYYIRRPADDLVDDLAGRIGETLVIKAPRQIGKSSLLLYYLAQCQNAGKKTVFIDFSIFSQEDFAAYAGFLSKIIRMLARTLRIELTREPKIESQSEMLWFIEDNILSVSDAPVVIAFDETDRVLGKEYQTDFFTMLRLWHNNRANITLPWEKVDLALVISTEPYLLIKENDRSPFNVAPPVELQPFSLEECRTLNQKYEDRLSKTQVEQLWELLQGHPYLARLAYYRLCCRDNIDFSTLLENAADEWGPFGDHLRALLAKIHIHPELLEALKQVIRKGTVPTEDLYYRLYGAGLIKREGDRINPSNLLYARYFKRAI